MYPLRYYTILQMSGCVSHTDIKNPFVLYNLVLNRNTQTDTTFPGNNGNHQCFIVLDNLYAKGQAFLNEHLLILVINAMA